METKICKKCGESKEPEEYRSIKDYAKGYCVQCSWAETVRKSPVLTEITQQLNINNQKQTTMKTSNYELFSFFETNRPLSRKKVDRFKQSFIEVGYNEAFPVLCDDKYRIIDAQHRFQACKEMGLPIFYQFDKSGIPPETMMVELNKVQTAWSTDAYILHFAKLGVKFHKSVVEFSEKHGLAIAVSANIVCQSTTKLLPKVRDGINLPLNPRREEIAEFILSCKNTSFYKQKNFIGAVCSLFKRANNFQIEKIKRKIMSIPAQVSSTAYLMAFENIINKNTATKDRIILQKI